MAPAPGRIREQRWKRACVATCGPGGCEGWGHNVVLAFAGDVPSSCQVCAGYVPCVCHGCARFVPGLCHACARFDISLVKPMFFCARYVPGMCRVCAGRVPYLCLVGLDPREHADCGAGLWQVCVRFAFPLRGLTGLCVECCCHVCAKSWQALRTAFARFAQGWRLLKYLLRFCEMSVLSLCRVCLGFVQTSAWRMRCVRAAFGKASA
jgi:hypothetical protein